MEAGNNFSPAIALINFLSILLLFITTLYCNLFGLRIFFMAAVPENNKVLLFMSIQANILFISPFNLVAILITVGKSAIAAAFFCGTNFSRSAFGMVLFKTVIS